MDPKRTFDLVAAFPTARILVPNRPPVIQG
jgi:hypothetical protein